MYETFGVKKPHLKTSRNKKKGLGNQKQMELETIAIKLDRMNDLMRKHDITEQDLNSKQSMIFQGHMNRTVS